MSSSFHVDAKLNCNISELREHIDKLGHPAIAINDDKLKYEISNGSREKTRTILELSNEYICLWFSFSKKDLSIYRDNFLKFISLLEFLKGIYTVNFDNIYCYVVEALSQNWHDVVKDQSQVIENLKERIRSLDESNCSISYQLIGLSKENRQILADLSIYKDFVGRITRRVKEDSSKSSNNALAYLGIEPDLIKRLETELNPDKG